ncbi:polysaccharide biosynthesis C-terminal domain-containing protein [uncultured Wocania sp.]|uniref:MATE family efflux transporter n=1 Tax=uncultured Wocania sp. TaxID=2834404 RepID=UPI0030F77140
MRYLKNLLVNARIIGDSKKGYFYYILGEGVSKGTIFLLLAFYTNYFSKRDFGILSLFWVAVPLMSVLIDFSQRSYLKYYYIHTKKNTEELLSSVKYFCLSISGILLLIFLFKDELGVYLIDRISDYFVLFCALFYALIELDLSLFQIKGDYKKYNVFFILRNGFPYIITALVLVFFKTSVFTFMKVQLIVFFCLAIYNFRKVKKININKCLAYIKPGLNFSAPFIPAMLSVLVLSFSDRFIINYYFSEVEVADYTVAYTISSIFMAFFLATNKMWQKFILENLKLKNFEKIRIASRRYILIVLSVGLLIILLRKHLVFFLSNKTYLSIVELIPVIVIGMFFCFLYTILSNIPFFYKNTRYLALPAIIAAMINIVFNVILIPIYGYKIAALTTAISYAVEFLVIYLICLKKYKIDIIFHGLTKRII